MQNNIFMTVAASAIIVLMCTLYAVPLVHAQGSQGPIGGGGITNPLADAGSESITDVLRGVINWMLGLVGILALIALIIGGTRMIIDFGNEDQVKKAKSTILWAVIGLSVVILSYAIINIVTTEILGAGDSYDSAP